LGVGSRTVSAQSVSVGDAHQDQPDSYVQSLRCARLLTSDPPHELVALRTRSGMRRTLMAWQACGEHREIIGHLRLA